MNAALDPGDAATGAAARWRILLVEDSPDDAELTCITLAEAGMDAECLRVDSEMQLLEALSSFAPQLVLSDFNLPGFDGTRALELVRAHAPAARFVFLSGAPTDDDTVAADGALLKDHLAQLPALVQGLLGD